MAIMEVEERRGRQVRDENDWVFHIGLLVTLSF